MQEMNNVQSELIQTKAKAFELYQQIEQASKYIQDLEKAMNEISTIVNFKDLGTQGLVGLLEHLKELRSTPAEVEVITE